VRLLLAIPYFAPAYAFGGSVTVAETVVTGFLAAGHDVTVATTDVLDEHRRLSPDAPPQPEGAEVVRFPNLSHALATRANAYAPRGMRGWLDANLARFDAVLLHDLYSAVSAQTARAAAAAKVPYVLQPLGTLSPARERGRPLAKRAFLNLWGARTIREASVLIHSSGDERQDMLDAGAAPSQLVQLPLPLDLPDDVQEPEADKPTVTYVGRLHPIKRIDRLIQAVALARRDVPDLRLEIVGPGQRHGRDLAQVAARLGIAEKVRFHGFVSVEDKLRMLARAHVSALLSASEGLPMAALEAMACGTPVVLSRGCHLPEVHERAGLVVDGEPAQAAAALTTLLEDGATRRRFANGALSFAREFRQELVIPQMVRVFEDVAGSGRSRTVA
jgi:glycosyltransferase involved in cell wall biosynthesis